MKAHIYLNFNGNTEEAFYFYKDVFGGDFGDIYRMKDAPGLERLQESEREKIMHISLPIGDNVVLMGTDALESMDQHLVYGNNYSIYLETESEKEAERLFQKLSEGGKVEMNLEKTFWGAYFGNFTDKFGVQWMISYTYPKGM